MYRPLAPAGRLFDAAAFLEGFTWTGLLIGMLSKFQLTDSRLRAG
jgi:hypothetical protein